MSLDPLPPDDVESLVRGYLADRERGVDPTRTLEGVRSRLAAGGGPSRRRHALGRPLRWAAGFAASALVVGLSWTSHQASAQADAVRLVGEARGSLAAAKDRAYRVAIDLAPGMAERSPLLAALAGHEATLWARAGRCWVEAKRPGSAWSLGRDERGHAWLATPAGVGLDFEAGEFPEPLEEALELMKLDLDGVLGLLATDFDVSTPTRPAPGLRRIRGTPRADRPRPHLGSILVEIDERTKVVRQVVLSRVRGNRPQAEVSYILEVVEDRGEAAYRLDAHLVPDAETLGPDRPVRRRRELRRFFGSLLMRGE